MPSVASEPHVFPPARALPDLRPSGAQDLPGLAEPGGFAKLLDSKPAHDPEPGAKPDRHDDAGPAKGSRRSNTAHAKHAKDKAPAQDQAPADPTSQAAAEETSQDAAQQASGDTPKDADRKTSEAADESALNGDTAEAGMDPSIAVDGAALADALFPITISTTPVAATPAAAPTVAAEAALPVPTIAAAEAAPVAAPSAALPAQAAQASVTPAGVTNELSAAKPAAQPAKAQPQSSAPGETPGPGRQPRASQARLITRATHCARRGARARR